MPSDQLSNESVTDTDILVHTKPVDLWNATLADLNNEILKPKQVIKFKNPKLSKSTNLSRPIVFKKPHKLKKKEQGKSLNDIVLNSI